MPFVINFPQFSRLVVACNGRTDDAILLTYLLSEYKYCGCDVDGWFIATYPMIKDYTGLSAKQAKAIFPRLASRFGLQKKQAPKNSSGGNANYYKIDGELFLTLLDLYA
jgi:hypothetical protein